MTTRLLLVQPVGRKALEVIRRFSIRQPRSPKAALEAQQQQEELEAQAGRALGTQNLVEGPAEQETAVLPVAVADLEGRPPMEILEVPLALALTELAQRLLLAAVLEGTAMLPAQVAQEQRQEEAEEAEM